MQKSSKVWVVYRSFSGDTGAWQYREQEVVSEHPNESEARAKAHQLDFGKGPGDTGWHFVREMTKNVTYY